MWDDIDHLSNRRVRAVGELIQGKFRIGLARMSRIARDRMSLADIETVTPAQLIHVTPGTRPGTLPCRARYLLCGYYLRDRARLLDLRRRGVAHHDSVPEAQPPLPSPCNF